MWPFVAIALAASLVGFLAGQFVDVRALKSSGLENVATLTPDNNENLTPVSFNLDAFNLLHGHSQEMEADSCNRCHVGAENDTPKSFHGWYYGDKQFFEKHEGESFKQKCSDCHRLNSQRQQPEKVKGSLPKFEHRKMSDCSACHVARTARP